MTINMRTVIERIICNCKHKRCNTRTTEIKITTTRKVVNNYIEKRRKGRQQLT